MRRYNDWRESPRSRAALAITPSWRVSAFSISSRCDARRACKQAGTSDAVAQFAHVAGPVVTHQRALGIRQQRIPGLEKVPCQRQDVVATVGERRYLQFDDVEPVVEVFTEAALPDRFPERCVGR